MGFLDDVKKGADKLANDINRGLASGQGTDPKEALFRDLGVLAYLEHTNRAPEDARAERDRVLAALGSLESSGVSLDFVLRSNQPPPPPPPPGAAAAQAPPPPPGTFQPQPNVPPPPAPPTDPQTQSAPPPPPPSAAPGAF